MTTLIDTMYKTCPDTTKMVLVIMMVTCYVFAKTILWWLLFGTGKLLFRKISLTEWINKTLSGMVIGVCLMVMNFILMMAFNPGNMVYETAVIVCTLLSARIIWRELFTLCGILRGDWHPFHPELRFFAWDTFNIWVIFKPLKMMFSSPFKNGHNSSNDTPWGSYSDAIETHIVYQRQGTVH